MGDLTSSGVRIKQRISVGCLCASLFFCFVALCFSTARLVVDGLVGAVCWWVVGGVVSCRVGPRLHKYVA